MFQEDSPLVEFVPELTSSFSLPATFFLTSGSQPILPRTQFESSYVDEEVEAVVSCVAGSFVDLENFIGCRAKPVGFCAFLRRSPRSQNRNPLSILLEMINVLTGFHYRDCIVVWSKHSNSGRNATFLGTFHIPQSIPPIFVLRYPYE
jgi:hypothetical protein